MKDTAWEAVLTTCVAGMEGYSMKDTAWEKAVLTTCVAGREGWSVQARHPEGIRHLLIWAAPHSPAGPACVREPCCQA